MDFEFIFPSKLIETFVVLRKLGYEKNKNFCCKNLRFPKFDISSLRDILKKRFNYDYFAFGQWYLRNTKSSAVKRKHLTIIYKRGVQNNRELSDFFSEEKEQFVKSFKGKIKINKKNKILIFFNILDFYNHAFNWPYKNNYIISIAPRIDKKFNWNALRHEILHIILKQNSKFKIEDPILKKIAPKGYEDEEDRVILDEIIVLTLCLLFKDRKKINKILRFYDSIGYNIINDAYQIIIKFPLPITINSKFQRDFYFSLKKK